MEMSSPENLSRAVIPAFVMPPPPFSRAYYLLPSPKVRSQGGDRVDMDYARYPIVQISSIASIASAIANAVFRLRINGTFLRGCKTLQLYRQFASGLGTVCQTNSIYRCLILFVLVTLII